jgi:hypothetical protein
MKGRNCYSAFFNGFLIITGKRAKPAKPIVLDIRDSTAIVSVGWLLFGK